MNASPSVPPARASVRYRAMPGVIVLLAVLVAGGSGLVSASREESAPPVAAWPGCVPPAGTIVQNGSFESPIHAVYVTYTAPATVGGWTVASGSVDIEPGWQDADGDQSLDLAGDAPGLIYQDLCTMPGVRYELSFYLAGNPGEVPVVKTMDVWWNGQRIATPSFDTTGHSVTSMGWTLYQYTVQATGTTTRLLFRDASIEPSRSGPALDAISVQALPGQMTATPAPCVPASGNMVQNGSFETPGAPSTGFLDIAAPGTVGAWTVDFGSVDVTSSWQDADGDQSLDLAGYHQGTIYQDICTTPGALYRLRFAMAGNPNEDPTIKTMEVWWGSEKLDTLYFSTVGRSLESMGWVFYEYTLPATGPITRLLFRDAYIGTTRSGPTLDAVSLDSALLTPTATAEPSSTATLTAVPGVTATAAAATATAAATPPLGRNTSLFLPLVQKLALDFPIAINQQSVETRSIGVRGESYYSATLSLPRQLPARGRFYLSAAPNRPTPVKVDEVLIVVVDGVAVYEQFLTSPKLVEVARADLAAWAAAGSIQVQFRDRSGSAVGSDLVWLIWVP